MENRIKKLRECRNISQEELATALDTTQQSISLYESGDREPKLKVWQKLADYFDVSVPYLQGFDEHKPNRLKELRQHENISQGELAKATGLTRQAISNYERGNRDPSKETWQQLADYFEVTVPYLKNEIDTEYLEKLIELTLFFCFPKIVISYGDTDIDDEFKPFIIIEILSRMLSLLGYCSKDKFLEMYNRVIKLVDDTETIEYLQDFKNAVIQLLPMANGTTKNLLNSYENL